jgi:hypothetical protein
MSTARKLPSPGISWPIPNEDYRSPESPPAGVGRGEMAPCDPVPRPTPSSTRLRPHEGDADALELPYLTTRAAAAYCGFKSTSALRKAKLEGRLAPVGRRGGRGTLMWSREALDRYLRGEPPATFGSGRARTPSLANGGEDEEGQELGSEVEQLGRSESGATRHLSAKGGRVSRSRASHRSQDGSDTAGCPKPAGPDGTRGSASLVEDGAGLDPQGCKPADEQGASPLEGLRRFLTERKG